MKIGDIVDIDSGLLKARVEKRQCEKSGRRIL